MRDMTDAEIDRNYDAIDQMMRDGEFKRLNGLLSALAICVKDAGIDKTLTYLTATLPAKSKLRARKRLLAEARRVFIETGLFDGLD